MKFKKKLRPNNSDLLKVIDDLESKIDNYKYAKLLVMVSSELLENSVKYYIEQGINKRINFMLTIKHGIIEISIKDQKAEISEINSLIEIIDKINNSINPYTLFIERLQEVLDNRVKGESRLGLLRIASEGGFKLSYSYKNNKLTVCATKREHEEDINMKCLEQDDLKIEVKDIDGEITVKWYGKSRSLNPENFLDSYLDEIVDFSKGKSVCVHFEKLESMNSSTVPPILSFIKKLEEHRIESNILYNGNEDWQRASFKPLSLIAGNYEFVKIIPAKNK